MSDHAYDISYLLESEPAKVETRDLRITKTAPVAPPRPSLAQVQEAMARELMQAAEFHEALIQQYLQISGKAYLEASAQ
ncbi:hypothetical protein B0E46_08430 [Rhodanobacter sp. B04]|uniref:hypothetical protein n=1 Tax=Rhodanobacter sp. B04 TaxID=1945860 RepID=UPI0009857C85|nr:hypothetical protein [Rhodanobacter sp. B04]OOG63950.1 hypothetical protein B0E46_08430 [Rhodanobacter sp. B04]